MTPTTRLLLAAGLIAADLVAFAIPLTALGLAYVIASRPPGFLRWVLRLYGLDEHRLGRESGSGEAAN